MDTLDDLGAQLHALTSDQPAQPGDRVPAVTRRATRIRRTRAAVAVAAAVAVLAPAGLLLTSYQGRESTTFAHSDVLSWPDRSAPSEVRVAQGALDSYVASVGTTPDRVQWLYRHAVTTPDGAAHVAVFVATTAGKSVLVTAVRRDDLASGTERAGWATKKSPLALGRVPDHVGQYLTYNDPRATGGPTNTFGNLAVLLADPDARQVVWEEQPLPFAPTQGSPKKGAARSADGTFILDVGALRGPLRATVSSGDESASYPLSLQAAPELVRPQIAVPEGWAGNGGGAFQSDPDDAGAWATPAYSVFETADTVLVSCYGGGTLLVKVTADADDRVLTSARVPCEGNAHDIRHPHGVAPGKGATLRAYPTQLQAIAFVSGRSG